MATKHKNTRIINGSIVIHQLSSATAVFPGAQAGQDGGRYNQRKKGEPSPQLRIQWICRHAEVHDLSCILRSTLSIVEVLNRNANISGIIISQYSKFSLTLLPESFIKINTMVENDEKTATTAVRLRRANILSRPVGCDVTSHQLVFVLFIRRIVLSASSS